VLHCKTKPGAAQGPVFESIGGPRTSDTAYCHSPFARRRRGRSSRIRRRIPTLGEGPGPGEFCAESLFGGRKADMVVGLWDRRTLPLECQVSNSATNSIQRLNNDAAVKAVEWRREFGEPQVVPAAVLSGGFKLRHLEYAQERGLALFWAHDLHALLDWIERTHGGPPAGRAR